MSLAATNMRGAFLYCRFAVNGIQKALRSLGTALELDTASRSLLVDDFFGLVDWLLTWERKPKNFDQLEKC
jgi:hypothetical protein